MPAQQIDPVSSPNGSFVGLPSKARAHGRVAEIQRARLIAGTIRATTDVGAHNLTVADIVAEAGVSRRTFYEIFDDCEGCFLAAFDEAIAHFAERLAPIWHASDRWQQRTRAAITMLLTLFDEERSMARFLVVEAMGAGPKALVKRQQAIATLTAAVDEVRAESSVAAGAPPLTAEGVVGGALSVLHGRLAEPRQRPLVELVNPFMSMIVMPDLGAAAARRELSQPLPAVARTASGPEDGRLRELGMRVTYRTACALAAVAAHPGASNRTIADASGISDQGQVSKLLGRLEKFGLVQNDGAGAGMRGAANAWRLTERGEEVHHVLAANSSG
jgi:AcrR family transcriptional regulator